MVPGFPVSVVGLVGLLVVGRARALRPLLLVALLTFWITTLVFPVATTWGTFLHASVPAFVLLLVAAAGRARRRPGLGRAEARLDAARGLAGRPLPGLRGGALHAPGDPRLRVPGGRDRGRVHGRPGPHGAGGPGGGRLAADHRQPPDVDLRGAPAPGPLPAERVAGRRGWTWRQRSGRSCSCSTGSTGRGRRSWRRAGPAPRASRPSICRRLRATRPTRSGSTGSPARERPVYWPADERGDRRRRRSDGSVRHPSRGGEGGARPRGEHPARASPSATGRRSTRSSRAGTTTATPWTTRTAGTCPPSTPPPAARTGRRRRPRPPSRRSSPGHPRPRATTEAPTGFAAGSPCGPPSWATGRPSWPAWSWRGAAWSGCGSSWSAATCPSSRTPRRPASPTTS